MKNPSYLEGVSSATNKDIEVHEGTMESISEDVYIMEGYKIMLDILRLK